MFFHIIFWKEEINNEDKFAREMETCSLMIEKKIERTVKIFNGQEKLFINKYYDNENINTQIHKNTGKLRDNEELSFGNINT